MNVRYFLLTDQVEKENLSVEFCPTDVMWADFITKPLQGEKFRKFCDEILGQSSTEWNEWVEVAYRYLEILSCDLNYGVN